MERIIKFFKIKNPTRVKKWIYILAVSALTFWVVFRITMLIIQHNQNVYNLSRDVTENGTPVITITAQNSSGTLHEPITVEKNKAYVTGSRVGLFRAWIQVCMLLKHQMLVMVCNMLNTHATAILFRSMRLLILGFMFMQMVLLNCAKLLLHTVMPMLH